MIMSHPVVQAEFFRAMFIGFGTPSLEDFMSECQERIAEDGEFLSRGPTRASRPLKTVVRFYDSTGTLLKLIQRTTKTEYWYQSLWFRCFSGTGFSARLLFLLVRLLGMQKERLRRRVRSLAVERVRMLVSNRNDLSGVVVEDSHHQLRPLRPDEAVELLETIEGSLGGMRIFVFKPNNLLSDENEILVSLS